MDAVKETVENDAENTGTGNKTWIIIIGIVVVTLIAIMLVPSEKEAPPEDIPLPGQTASTNSSDTSTGTNTPGAAARAFISALQANGGTPDEAFIEALRQQAAGNHADAYLLYFYAARNGHSDAALVLGEQADPAHFSPGNSLLESADPEQAYKWYSQAATAGSLAADSRLATLIETVEASASAGDEQAQRLMLQWK